MKDICKRKLPTRTSSRTTAMFLAAVVALSLVAVGAVAPAVAQEDPDSDLTVDADETVAIDGETTITVSSSGAEYLGVKGDTTGWTVEGLDPAPVIIGNPTDTPYESGDETWYYADQTVDDLTITLSADVEPGTYTFTAFEQDLDNNVVAEETFTIEVAAKQIDVEHDVEIVENGETTVTVDSTDAEYLGIEGDTDGWTVEEMDPTPAIIGNPTELPYESGDETWYYADQQTDDLTITLSATAAPGTYDFTAIERDTDDDVIADQAFSITVVEGHESGVSKDLFNEIDKDGDNNPNLGDIRSSVNEWSSTGKVGDTDANLADLRAIVDWWSS